MVKNQSFLWYSVKPLSIKRFQSTSKRHMIISLIRDVPVPELCVKGYPSNGREWLRFIV